METLLVEVLKLYGPFAALVVYYVWRDFITAKASALREERLLSRLNQIEDFQRKEMSDMVYAMNDALKENTLANMRLSEAIESKPCLMGVMEHRT